jgi:hypothetical protein
MPTIGKTQITIIYIAPPEWEDMPALVEWSGKCTAVTAHNGVAIQGLW